MDRWDSTSTRSFSSRSTSRPCSACCCCSPGSRTPAFTRLPGGAARICCAPARSCCSACTARCRTRSRSISPTPSCSPPSPSPGRARGCSTDARRSRCISSAARCCGCLLSRAPFFADSLDAKVLLSSGIITAYTWATAYEFWRGRSEPLVSRWPAIFMLFAHGALFLLRTPLVAGAAVVADQPGVRQRVAHGAELRGAAVHHRHRLHPAGDGEGAHRAAPQDRGAGRSADRHRQPPRLPRRGRWR